MRNPALIALYAITGAFFIAGIWFTASAMRYYGGFTSDAFMSWLAITLGMPLPEGSEMTDRMLSSPVYARQIFAGAKATAIGFAVLLVSLAVQAIGKSVKNAARNTPSSSD